MTDAPPNNPAPFSALGVGATNSDRQQFVDRRRAEVNATRPGEGVGANIAKRSGGATARARKLRVEDTEAEYRLWGDLRGRHLNGYKFARQIPLGPYIVDFICRSEMLVVELDGSQHADSVRDQVRTEFLNRNGYSVLRFWNHEVLRERRALLETVLAALEGGLAPSPDLRFAPATLSPGEEEGAELDRRTLWRRRQKESKARKAGRPPLPAGERVDAKRPGEGA